MDVQTEQPFLTDEAAQAKYDELVERFSAMPLHATCLEGEVAVFFHADRAYGPGHIYSDAGRAEFLNNTGWCEYHFDLNAPKEEE